MTINTACSSNLVAVDQVVQTLREGRSRVAIATRAILILGPENYIAESKLKMLLPNGRRRTSTLSPTLHYLHLRQLFPYVPSIQIYSIPLLQITNFLKT
jgi:hypothetical protein